MPKQSKRKWRDTRKRKVADAKLAEKLVRKETAQAMKQAMTTSDKE